MSNDEKIVRLDSAIREFKDSYRIFNGADDAVRRALRDFDPRIAENFLDEWSAVSNYKDKIYALHQILAGIRDSFKPCVPAPGTVCHPPVLGQWFPFGYSYTQEKHEKVQEIKKLAESL
jgi:hypothetical protein